MKPYNDMWQVLFLLVIVQLRLQFLAFASDVKAFDDTVLFKINWPGLTGNELLEPPDVEPLLVTSANSEQYRCLLPHYKEKEKETEEMYHGPNPLELLAPLFSHSSCSYRLEAYWTYELCHGRYIRQYHEEREGKKVKLQEYYLGKWDKNIYATLSEEYDKLKDEKALSDIPLKKIDGMNMPYLQVNMTDGTLCDLNGKARMTRVLYVCYRHGKHEIYSIKETSTCEYEIIVLSPFLCQHPKYRPKQSEENVISCHPLGGAPRKPRDMMLLERESSKLRRQKIIDEQFQKIYAVFSIDRNADGQQNGEARVRVEIHPVEVIVDQDDTSQHKSTETHTDSSLVDDFLKGRHCLSGRSGNPKFGKYCEKDKEREGSGWWKYEFCYGKSVDQYHEEKDGTRAVVNLGKFNLKHHIEWLEKNPHKKPKALPQRKHVSHFYSEGTKCDKSGRPRHVEVKLKCLENSSPSAVALYLIEPKVCEYILGVESPIICNLLDKVDEHGLVRETLFDLEDVTVSEEEEEEYATDVINGE